MHAHGVGIRPPHPPPPIAHNPVADSSTTGRVCCWLSLFLARILPVSVSQPLPRQDPASLCLSLSPSSPCLHLTRTASAIIAIALPRPSATAIAVTAVVVCSSLPPPPISTYTRISPPPPPLPGPPCCNRASVLYQEGGRRGRAEREGGTEGEQARGGENEWGGGSGRALAAVPRGRQICRREFERAWAGPRLVPGQQPRTDFKLNTHAAQQQWSGPRPSRTHRFVHWHPS